MWVASARIDDGARPTDSSAAVLHNGVSAVMTQGTMTSSEMVLGAVAKFVHWIEL